VKGWQNQQDYGMRIYDPRAGRFLSVDPITAEYPELTPYQFASNRPIDGVDLDGKEWELSTEGQKLTRKYAHLENLRFQTDEEKMRELKPIEYIGQDIFGNVQTGTAETFQSKLKAAERQYNSAVGENVRGGFFGAMAYWIWGKEASFAGAQVDQVATGVHVQRGSGNSTRPQKQVTTPIAAQAEQVKAVHRGNNNSVQVNTANSKGTSSPTIQQKRATSIQSQSLVRSRLESQLGPDEILIEQPRFYIGDGANKKLYAVPDFAIYNTKTNQFVRIPDAKNGGGALTGNQKLLNEQGGTFNGSDRYPQAQPQSIRPGLVTIEKTTLPYN
jgi:hypothetical protein